MIQGFTDGMAGETSGVPTSYEGLEAAALDGANGVREVCEDGPADFDPGLGLVGWDDVDDLDKSMIAK